MRIFLVVAIVLLVVALICVAVPTLVLTEDGTFWLILGLISWACDQVLGGYVWSTPARRQVPPA